MKRSTHAILGALAACTLCTAATLAQETKKAEDAAKKALDSAAPKQPDGGAAPSPEEMMKMWEQMQAPNEHHAQLAAFVGEWTAETKMWMDPNAPPMVERGTAKIESLHEGRFIKMSYSGTMMGKPFTGVNIMGYNNTTKKHESFWFDSTSTGMMFTTGDCSADGKTITTGGTCDDPFTGGKATIKYVTRLTGADSFVFEMYRVVDGKDVREGEITYTRAGKSAPTTKETLNDAAKTEAEKIKDAAKREMDKLTNPRR